MKKLPNKKILRDRVKFANRMIQENNLKQFLFCCEGRIKGGKVKSIFLIVSFEKPPKIFLVNGFWTKRKLLQIFKKLKIPQGDFKIILSNSTVAKNEEILDILCKKQLQVVRLPLQSRYLNIAAHFWTFTRKTEIIHQTRDSRTLRNAILRVWKMAQKAQWLEKVKSNFQSKLEEILHIDRIQYFMYT